MDDLFRIFPDLPGPRGRKRRRRAERLADMRRKIMRTRQSIEWRRIAVYRMHQDMLARRQSALRQLRPEIEIDAFRRIRDLAASGFDRLTPRQRRLAIGATLRSIGAIADAAMRGTLDTV